MHSLNTSTLTAARQRAAHRPDVLRAIERAAVLLPASAVTPLDNGALRIVSARSGQAYVVSSDGCTCAASVSGGRVCWHLVARRLIELATRAPRCGYCKGAMHASTTYGGEASYTCGGCGHEGMASVLDAE